MAEEKPLAPIIIKRKKVVAGDGHHGGAWKVAYADFVTAMMAFFLLMWLLNATTEKQRKGLADYFSPVIPINRISGGGEGAFWGDSVFAEDTLAQNGTGATMLRQTEKDRASGDAGQFGMRQQKDSMKASQDLMRVLAARSGESLQQLDDMPHVVTRVSDMGVEIDVFAMPDAPLFDPVSDAPTERMVDTLRWITRSVETIPNQLSVEAHVIARPLVVAKNPVWDQSGARAQAVRATLEAVGLPPGRLLRITGYADRRPFLPADPMALRNSRVVVTILRSDL